MKRALLGIAIAAVAMMGVAQSVSADALDDIKKAGKIRIAVDLGVPPMSRRPRRWPRIGASSSSTYRPLARRAFPRCRPARPTW